MSVSHEHGTRVCLEMGRVLFDLDAFQDVLVTTITSVAALPLEKVSLAVTQLLRGPWTNTAWTDAFAAVQISLSDSQCVAIQQALEGVLADTSVFVHPDVPMLLNWIAVSGVAFTGIGEGDADAQHRFLHASGLEAFFSDVRFVSEEETTHVLTELCAEHPEDRLVYVETRRALLDTVKSQFPDVIAVQLKRTSTEEEEGTPSLTADHVLRSLVGLPRAVDSCLACIETDGD